MYLKTTILELSCTLGQLIGALYKKLLYYIIVLVAVWLFREDLMKILSLSVSIN